MLLKEEPLLRMRGERENNADVDIAHVLQPVRLEMDVDGFSEMGKLNVPRRGHRRQ